MALANPPAGVLVRPGRIGQRIAQSDGARGAWIDPTGRQIQVEGSQGIDTGLPIGDVKRVRLGVASEAGWQRAGCAVPSDPRRRQTPRGRAIRLLRPGSNAPGGRPASDARHRQRADANVTTTHAPAESGRSRLPSRVVSTGERSLQGGQGQARAGGPPTARQTRYPDRPASSAARPAWRCLVTWSTVCSASSRSVS